MLESHTNPIFQSKIQHPPLRQTSVTSGQNPASTGQELEGRNKDHTISSRSQEIKQAVILAQAEAQLSYLTKDIAFCKQLCGILQSHKAPPAKGRETLWSPGAQLSVQSSTAQHSAISEMAISISRMFLEALLSKYSFCPDLFIRSGKTVAQMVHYHKHWCKKLNAPLALRHRFITFLLSFIQAMFLQWPRELSLKELPAQGNRKWQLQKRVPEWWIAGYRAPWASRLPINELQCIGQGHTWQAVSPTLPRRDYKPTSAFSEGFFRTSLKCRDLQAYYYVLLSWTDPFWATGGKQIEKNRGEKKKTRKDLPFTFNCDMKIQAMETAYAGGNRRGHSPLGGETWAYPCRIENQTGVSGVSGSISSNKKVHRQCKKRRWIHRSCWDRNFW